MPGLLPEATAASGACTQVVHLVLVEASRAGRREELHLALLRFREPHVTTQPYEKKKERASPSRPFDSWQWRTGGAVLVHAARQAVRVRQRAVEKIKSTPSAQQYDEYRRILPADGVREGVGSGPGPLFSRLARSGGRPAKPPPLIEPMPMLCCAAMAASWASRLPQRVRHRVVAPRRHGMEE